MKVALVLSLALIGVASAARAEVPPARQGELRDFVSQDCGSCHGMTRNGGLGSPLTVQAMRELGDEALVATILDGRPGTPMPPWRGLLTEPEAQWIVKHLKGDVP
ncbi:Cytochrome c55X [Magnetospirillum sp. LM-5]|uniref:c-type cytochrome n=1 Tax=Magnetospirillum sp. LM-5 TaxID=2681466 RepID=UPI0013811CE6|nr:cytochrome c [Magnetospirillum sp. LM-5]CAA7611372.1 Cytochrome c55X [Magnetospirillum sp. LM-5]